jgi:hypothetical protein
MEKTIEWISVNDKLPQPFQAVYVAGGVGLWTGTNWNTITGYQWPGQPIAWEVTHWMLLPEPPNMEKTKTGIELIAQERQEQIEKHGRTIDRDIAENDKNQLSSGASILALNYPFICLEVYDVEESHCPPDWDQELWCKMVNKPYKERLIIAGALIAAEIDRLQNS